MAKNLNRYSDILAGIFRHHHSTGTTSFEFRREELEQIASGRGIRLPKNLGDLIYSFRYRARMPDEIVRTAPAGKEWVIEGAGRSAYRFVLVRTNRIVPGESHDLIKIPDATPQIVARNAKSDEQALLAKVRYNRLIDLFLRIAAYSLQSHLRTFVKTVGQVETDEVYVGVRNTGQQFVVPVQAKGGKDQISVVQIRQDLAFCRAVFPDLTARPVAVQFRDDAGEQTIVMFELAERDAEIRIVDEKHYRLVPAADISGDELRRIAERCDDTA